MAEQGHVKELVESFHSRSIGTVPHLNFLLIGLSGAGKSTLINNLLGKEVAKVSDTVESHSSSHIRSYPGEIDGVPIVVYDTPGLGDSRGDFDDDHLAKTKAILDKSDIHIVIYCLKMNETRMNESLLRAFQQFERIGIDWGKTVFALTFADAVNAPTKIKKAADFDKAMYFNERLAVWKQEIPQSLSSACKCDLSNVKINPTTDERDAKLPNGKEWFVPFWMDVLTSFPPGPLTRFLDVHKKNVLCVQSADSEDDVLPKKRGTDSQKLIVLWGKDLEIFVNEVGVKIEKGIWDSYCHEDGAQAISISFSPDSVGKAVVDVYGFGQ